MKKLSTFLLLCAAINMLGCGPTDEGKTPEEICNDYGYSWDCVKFSTAAEKCRCNAFPDGGSDPQAAGVDC